MCGIVGIIKKTDKVDSVSLKIMTDAISHRGPDGEGHWVHTNNKVGLGHRRLSILDLSDAANQPMHSPCGNYTMVFNGEIYNYLELKQDLLDKGEIFQTESDSEILLRLYMLFKEKCLEQLDGMWSFAIWDEQNQELFCARDRFGEKPFHYCIDDTGFYFASEMKALWALGIPKKKNKHMFELYDKSGLIHNPEDLSETFYENIYRLEHSHWMKVSISGQVQLHKYYDIDWENKSYTGTFEEAQTEFKNLFIKSLKYRLRSDVPVGTSLSGGLDSSTIVCALHDYLADGKIDANTFSARFKNYKKDEGKYIHQVLEKTNFSGHETWPTGSDFKGEFKELCTTQEEPFGSASIYAQYSVQKLAKKKNVTVLIDGQGADEILAGYIFYYPIYLSQLQISNTSFGQRTREHNAFIDFHTPHAEWKKTLIKYSFFYELKNRRIIKEKKNKNLPNLSHTLYKSTMCGDLQDLLRYADRNSMAHSREVRLPFLSHELVEFCFSLPDSYKLNLGWTKFILRKAFETSLPYEVCWRKEKVGFEPPQLEWMESFAEKDWTKLMMSNF